jgi:hypothetical protein
LKKHTVTGHAWLAGNASWDDDDFSTSQTLAQSRGSLIIAGNLAPGVDVADISSDTCLAIALVGLVCRTDAIGIGMDVVYQVPGGYRIERVRKLEG